MDTLGQQLGSFRNLVMEIGRPRGGSKNIVSTTPSPRAMEWRAEQNKSTTRSSPRSWRPTGRASGDRRFSYGLDGRQSGIRYLLVLPDGGLSYRVDDR